MKTCKSCRAVTFPVCWVLPLASSWGTTTSLASDHIMISLRFQPTAHTEPSSRRHHCVLRQRGEGGTCKQMVLVPLKCEPAYHGNIEKSLEEVCSERRLPDSKIRSFNFGADPRTLRVQTQVRPRVTSVARYAKVRQFRDRQKDGFCCMTDFIGLKCERIPRQERS